MLSMDNNPNLKFILFQIKILKFLFLKRNGAFRADYSTRNSTRTQTCYNWNVRQLFDFGMRTIRSFFQYTKVVEI